MSDIETNIPQVSNPDRENLTSGSDRVKASVAGAGSADFGGSHLSQPSIAALWKMLQDVERKFEKELQEMKTILQDMTSATLVQKNVNVTIKKGIPVLEAKVSSLLGTKRDCAEVRSRLESMTSEPRTPTIKKSQAKRKADDAISPESQTPAGKKVRQRGPQPHETTALANSPKQNAENDGFTVVEPKKKIRKRNRQEKERKRSDKAPVTKGIKPTSTAGRSRKPRAEAVLVRPAEGKSFADVLKKVKESVDLSSTQTTIKGIKKTREGLVLLEIKSTRNKAEFSNAIRQAVGEDATSVQNRTPQTTIEIRDMDACSTEEEVGAAIAKLDIAGDVTVRVTPANSRGQRMAIIRMPEAEATKLTKLSRIVVGWVSCRIRRRIDTQRCYKCFGFDHQARTCQGQDRSRSCFKCGKVGHRAVDCRSEPRCVLCAELTGDEAKLKHILGTSRCQAFRNALESRKPTRKNG